MTLHVENCRNVLYLYMFVYTTGEGCSPSILLQLLDLSRFKKNFPSILTVFVRRKNIFLLYSPAHTQTRKTCIDGRLRVSTVALFLLLYYFNSTYSMFALFYV